jgi:tRNA(Ile)-lysidine synthase
MIKLSCKIPIKVAIAVSGGMDSMACLDFLRFGKRDLTVLHFNHGTEFGKLGEKTVRDYCQKHNLKLEVGRLEGERDKNQSLEDYWRKERYAWFEKVYQGEIVTCHHLGDCVEWWVMTSLKGNPKLIPIHRENFIRPFLLTTKEDLKDWAERKEVCWVEDPSNENVDFQRNYIRHVMMEHVLKINPGIEKTIIKLIKKQM